VERDYKEEYEIEMIMDLRVSEEGRKEYLVKWLSYGENHNCWVAEDDMFAEEKIDEHRRRTREKARKARTEVEEVDRSETEFEVERLVGHRRGEREVEFRVKWKGYAEEENSWVAESKMNARERIDEYTRGERRSGLGRGPGGRGGRGRRRAGKGRRRKIEGRKRNKDA